MLTSRLNTVLLQIKKFVSPTPDSREVAANRMNTSLLCSSCISGCAIIVLIWSLAIFRSIEVQQQNLTDSTRDVVNISLVVERSVRESIAHLDHLLLLVRERKLKMPSSSWSEILGHEYTPGPNGIQLAVIGPDGFREATTIDSTKRDSSAVPQRVSLRDREHFRIHVNATRDELFISKPLIGRGTGKQSVQLTRGYWTSDGTFGGVLVASLDPSQLVMTFRRLDLGVGGGVAILGSDDVIRAGTGFFEQQLGRSYREPESRRPIKVEVIGNLIAPSILEKQTLNGSERIVAIQPIEGRSLAVMVTTTAGVNNSAWISDTNINYFGTALLASLAVFFYMLRTFRSQHIADESLAQRNAMEIEKKVAEAAASERSLFLAVMSHEIRTPLNGVLGGLELMRQDALSERSVRHLQMATECGETLLGLIDDVLLFSKAEHDRIDLAQKPFVLETLCRHVHDAMAHLVTKAHNSISVSVCEEAARPVIGDAIRLRQVLVNLVGNASKFTSHGTITLRIEALPHEGSQLAARIRVTDTGIGIPKDKQKLIFNRFQTLDPSYSRRTDGTGLGLAICDKIVRAMGGEISLDSEVGRGSCFSFDLIFPYAQEQIAQTESHPSLDQAPKDFQPLRILLAEDNPTNAYVATQFLADAGHEVQHAVNGREAVAMAAVQPFDLILMDISMPEMDGVQATAAIRSSDSPNATVLIIALTAHAIEGDQTKFLGAQMDGYLSKPIRKTALLNAMTTRRTISPHEARAKCSSPHGEEPIIDMHCFKEYLSERSIDRALKTLSIFVLELEQKAAALPQIIFARDAHALQMKAHSTIGSGSMVGTARLVRLGRSIEKRCMSNETIDWSTAEEFLAIMKETLKAVQTLATKEAIEGLMSRHAVAA